MTFPVFRVPGSLLVSETSVFLHPGSGPETEVTR